MLVLLSVTVGVIAYTVVNESNQKYESIPAARARAVQEVRLSHAQNHVVTLDKPWYLTRARSIGMLAGVTVFAVGVLFIVFIRVAHAAIVSFMPDPDPYDHHAAPRHS